MTDNENLDVELAWFEKNRQEMCKTHLEKWVAVHGSEAIGYFDSFSLAYEAGIAKVGSGSLLVKQVLLEDEKFNAPAYTLGLIQIA